MATKKRPINVTISFTSMALILTAIVVVAGTLATLDLQFGLLLIIEGLILFVASYLCIIPLLNLWIIVNIDDFLKEIIVKFGYSWNDFTHWVFIIGIIPCIITTLIIDLFILFILFLYFTGNKCQVSAIMQKIFG